MVVKGGRRRGVQEVGEGGSIVCGAMGAAVHVVEQVGVRYRVRLHVVVVVVIVVEHVLEHGRAVKIHVRQKELLVVSIVGLVVSRGRGPGKGRGREVQRRVGVLHDAVNVLERRAVVQAPRKVQNTVGVWQYFLCARVQIPNIVV